MPFADVKPSVFVSATSADLRTTREIAGRALITLGCLPVAQSVFPTAGYVEVRELLRQKIQGCDAVIHVAGLRFGREPDPATLPPGAKRRSYTQMEFDLARELKKELYVFVCAEDYPYDAARPGTDPAEEPAELQDLQREHRSALVAGKELFHQLGASDDVAEKVKSLETRLGLLKAQLQRAHHQMRYVAAFVIAACLVILGWTGWREVQDHRRQDDAKIQYEDLKRLLTAREDMSAPIATQSIPVNRLGDLPDEQYYAELAQRSGLSRDAVMKAIAELKGSKGLDEQYQAAMLERRFQDAEAIELKKLGEQKRLLAVTQLATARSRLNIGRARYGRQEYTSALEILREALMQFDSLPDGRAADLALWGEIQTVIGGSHLFLSASLSGESYVANIEAAVRAYELALTACQREAFPLVWARTQCALGVAYSGQAQLAAPAQRQPLLGQAVAAYKHALEVYTKDTLPNDWAMAQYDLGIAYGHQAEQAAKPEREKLLKQAVAAYLHALDVYKRETTPNEWARTQIGLGFAYWHQASLADGSQRNEFLHKAVAAYKLALGVCTKETLPNDWARTQMNLALVYLSPEYRQWLSTDLDKIIDERVDAMQEVAELRDDGRAANVAVLLRSEATGNFEQARELCSWWLARHPEDVSMRADFAEVLLFCSQFDECRGECLALLQDHGEKLSASSFVPVAVIDGLAALLSGNVPAFQDSLRQAIAKWAEQPDDFQPAWSWKGIRKFLEVTTDPLVVEHKQECLAVLDAVDGKTRDEAVAALKKLIAEPATAAAAR